MAPPFTTRSGAPPLSVEAVAGYAYAAGFRGEALAVAVAITTPESGRDASVRVYNEATGDDSYGLWQINMLDLPQGPHLGPERRRQFGIGTDGQLVDPATNANAAWIVSGGGGSFTPWSAYKSGRYRDYLDEAREVSATVEARGGNPTSGTGAPASSGTAADLGRSDDITGAIPSAIDPTRGYAPSSLWDPGFFVRGQSAIRTLLAGTMAGGDLTLDVDEVAELSIEVEGLFQAVGGITDTLEVDTTVDWQDLMFVVAGHEWDEGDHGLHRFTARCRAQGPESMRKRPLRERVWARQSPTEVLYQVAGEHNLRFVGKGTNRRDDVTRKGPAEGAPTPPEGQEVTTESDWDLAQRLAKEEGFWVYESAGTLFFAPPSWLVTRMPRIDVNAWAGGVGGIDDYDRRDRRGVLGVPQGRRLYGDDLKPGMPSRTVTVKVPREIGEQVRPGMAADFFGLPSFAATYLVGRVSFPFDGGLEPAVVELREAIDPIPEPPTDPDTGEPVTIDAADTAGGGGASALDMVTIALRQIGDRYVYGAETSPDDPDPTEFDCSELIEWACARVGVSFPDYSETQIATVANAGLERDVGACANVRGALLHHPGHVAISLGDGAHTVEAMGRAYGVVQGSIGNRFSRGGLIPGLVYPPGS